MIGDKEGLSSMLWHRHKINERVNTEHLIWFSDDNQDQWMDANFYQVWMNEMEKAFYILGMTEQFQKFKTENTLLKAKPDGIPSRFVKVEGTQNRKSLELALSGLKGDSSFSLVFTQDDCGKSLRYKRMWERANNEWELIADMLGKTMVIALATDGFRYYIRGTEVGYDRETRHLFKKQNRLERLGTPVDPIWRAQVSGYTILICGDWGEIYRARKEDGYNLFQMLQLKVNEKLREVVREES